MTRHRPQPPSGPASQAPECMFTTGTPYGYRARPAEQVPALPFRRSPWRTSPVRCCPAGAQAVAARVSAERACRTARLAVRFPACAYIRPHAVDSCRNAVYTVILHYLGTPMPFEGRGGAAEPGRLANGAVTPAEPGAKRRSGRRRWWPRPTGATVRSGRRWCRREPWRLSGPACHAARPAYRPRWRCCGRVRGPRARPVPAPVARSSGARTVRQHAALPGRMPRVLA